MIEDVESYCYNHIHSFYSDKTRDTYEAINSLSNTEFLCLLSAAIEKRLADYARD